MSDSRDLVIQPGRSAAPVPGTKYFALPHAAKSIIRNGFVLGAQNILGYGAITGFSTTMFAYAPVFRGLSSLTTHLAFIPASSPVLSTIASTLTGLGANAIVGFFIWKGVVVIANVIRGHNADVLSRALGKLHKGDIPLLPRPPELD